MLIFGELAQTQFFLLTWTTGESWPCLILALNILRHITTSGLKVEHLPEDKWARSVYFTFFSIRCVRGSG